jgi:hypothetical protein
MRAHASMQIVVTLQSRETIGPAARADGVSEAESVSMAVHCSETLSTLHVATVGFAVTAPMLTTAAFATDFGKPVAVGYLCTLFLD